jgi:hypothetical protein
MVTRRVGEFLLPVAEHLLLWSLLHDRGSLDLLHEPGLDLLDLREADRPLYLFRGGGEDGVAPPAASSPSATTSPPGSNSSREKGRCSPRRRYSGRHPTSPRKSTPPGRPTSCGTPISCRVATLQDANQVALEAGDSRPSSSRTTGNS